MLKVRMTNDLRSLFQNRMHGTMEDLTFRSGVFCDITRSLVISDPSSPGNMIADIGIRAYLREQIAKGRTVTLVSKIEDNANAYGTGVIEEFGHIYPKAVYQSSLLEELIDDNPDYLQAQRWINPTAEEAQEFFRSYHKSPFAAIDCTSKPRTENR